MGTIMNITLSADDETVATARAWAAARGTSLNALVREYLASLGSDADRDVAARQFAGNARNAPGRSAPGEPFRRNSLYQGRRFGGGR